jgi:RNA polymerase sigma factor (sigma-70 family)
MMLLRTPELPNFEVPTINGPMGTVGTSLKPSVEEVLAYAAKQADKFLKDHATHLPPEQKEEIRQEALIRVANAYTDLDPERGWKSFVQNHSRGAVLDYLRDGTGFKESKWDDYAQAEAATAEQDEAEESDTAPDALESPTIKACGTTPRGARRFRQRLNHRVSVVNSDDGHPLDVEEVAGIYGIHSAMEESDLFRPNWDLVARMAAVDPEIHLVAKILRGFTQTELAPGFAVTREMLSQRIRTFFKKLDDPHFYHSPWIAQTIYAFGLSAKYHMDPVDNGSGWENDPVDLDSAKSLELMTLFQQEEFPFL